MLNSAKQSNQFLYLKNLVNWARDGRVVKTYVLAEAFSGNTSRNKVFPERETCCREISCLQFVEKLRFSRLRQLRKLCLNHIGVRVRIGVFVVLHVLENVFIRVDECKLAIKDINDGTDVKISG